MITVSSLPMDVIVVQAAMVSKDQCKSFGQPHLTASKGRQTIHSGCERFSLAGRAMYVGRMRVR
jgi:hypothetical protein